jgi:hypothetical protein
MAPPRAIYELRADLDQRLAQRRHRASQHGDCSVKAVLDVPVATARMLTPPSSSSGILTGHDGDAPESLR